MTARPGMQRTLRLMIALVALGGCSAPPLAPDGDPSHRETQRHEMTLALSDPIMLNWTIGQSAPVYYPGGAGRNVTATVAVTGTTAETCRDVEVRGPVNWVLFTEVGSGEDCYVPTHTRVLGPVAYDALDPAAK